MAQIWEKKAISAIGLRNYINRISKDFSHCLMDKKIGDVSLSLVSTLLFGAAGGDFVRWP